MKTIDPNQQEKALTLLKKYHNVDGVSGILEEIRYNPDDVAEILERNKALLRSLEGYGDVEPSSKDLFQRISEEIGEDEGPFPEAYQAGIAKKLGITVDALKPELRKYLVAREYQRGRDRRKKEIEKAGLLSPWTLASEYSKKRYIDDPNSSIFGEEGNCDMTTPACQDDLSDAIFGAFGAGLDQLPGLGVVAGPFMRSARDVYHTFFGDPYAKDWKDIGTDFLKDVTINAATSFGPAGIIKVIGRQLPNSSIGGGVEAISEKLAANKVDDAIKTGLGRLTKKVDIPTQTELNLAKLEALALARAENDAKERLARNATSNLSEADNLKKLTEFFSANDLPASEAKELAGLGYTVEDIADIAKMSKSNIQEVADVLSQKAKDVANGYSPVAELMDPPKKKILENLKNHENASGLVKRLPNSPLKSEMKTLVDDMDWKGNEMAELLMDWKRSQGKDFHVYNVAGYTTPAAKKLPKPVAAAAKRQADASDLSTMERLGLVGANTYNKAIAPLAKGAATVAGRGASKPKESLSAKHERWKQFGGSPDERKTDEYKQWDLENTKRVLGL